MTFEGPGALHWVPASLPSRHWADAAAGLVGFVLGTAAFGVIVLCRPVAAEPPAIVVVHERGVGASRDLSAPPPSTLKAPYSHAAATGTLHLPPKLGAPHVGVMLLPYGAVPRRPDD